MKSFLRGAQHEHVNLKNSERLKQAPVGLGDQLDRDFWAQLCHRFDILLWSGPEVAMVIFQRCFFLQEAFYFSI